uniref:Uncharacterized protein n=1 Tax=Plectus sambesii TaxID=2011161 RepID=A0A914XR91_9BILA
MIAKERLSDNQEKSRLLRNADDRLLDGTSMVTGASIHSGSSVGISSQQNRLQVQAEMCRRRPSVESGATSLGERFNYEEASTKAMAGSTYCDDKSVHTVCSAQEAVSYCEEVASTKACAGSVADAKSIGGGDSASMRVCTGSIGPDNASGRHVVHNDRGSPAPLLEEDSCDDNSGDQQNDGPSTSNAPLSGNCKTHRRQRAMSSVSYGRQSIELFEPIDGYELPVDDLPSTSHSSKNHHRRALLMSSDGDEGEFLLLSDDTFRQLHPSMKAINVRSRTVELTEPKKSRSVSMLLDSPSDLRQLLLTSTTDPWTVLRSIKSGRQADTSDKKAANAGSKVASYSSLPEDVITVEPVESDSPRRKGLLPKFLARRKR